MSTYVSIPREAFEAWAALFQMRSLQVGRELVFERTDPKYPGIVYRVYSSLPVQGTSSRGCGEDAIRVVALARSKTLEVPLGKTARVYRVTSIPSVFQRLRERLRSLAIDSRAVAGRVCPRCSGPAYSDTGRCYFRKCRETA